MRKILSFLLLICACSFAFAQSPFAVIDDADGYTNLRNRENVIVGKVYDSDILAIFQDSQEEYNEVFTFWNTPNTFIRYGMGEEGGDNHSESNLFIHQSRVKNLDQLPQLKNIKVGDHKTIFYDDEVTIEIITGLVDREARNIEFDPEGHGFPVKIGGYKTHGIDWPLNGRDTEVKSINCMVNGVLIHFEEKHIRGFLNITSEYLSVAKGKNNTIYIYGSGGDGSGGYYALWIIKDGEIKSAIAFSPY